MIRCENLTLGYDDAIIESVNLRVKPGEAIAILGPSGGGKSTLLKALAGLLPPLGGQLETDCHEPGDIGYVPQRLGLVRHATALQNVLQGGLHETPPWRSFFGIPDPALVARATAALAEVGLEAHAHAKVRNLSGGQQRRVATARTILQEPKLFLADEFLGELDHDSVNVVAGAVSRLRTRTKMTLVLVEHHMDHALLLADRVFQVKGGKLQEIQP
ncbi:MAG: ATP-binding cassette domain-containing protein [Thermoplasmatota archaeon]